MALALLRVIGGLGGLGAAGGTSGMSSGCCSAASSCGFFVATGANSLDDAGVGRCGLAGVGGICGGIGIGTAS